MKTFSASAQLSGNSITGNSSSSLTISVSVSVLDFVSVGQGVIPHLTIWYLSPRLFPLILLSTSASEALIAGGPSKARAGAITEFIVNDPQLFAQVFGASPADPSIAKNTGDSMDLSPRPAASASDKLARTLRSYKPPPLPPSPLLEHSPPRDSMSADLKETDRSNNVGIAGGWRCAVVVGLLVAAEWMEWWAWKVAGVRWAGVEVLSRENEVGGD